MASDPRTDRVAQLTEQFQEIVEHYFSIQCRYQSAIREVQTKLEILDDEFHSSHAVPYEKPALHYGKAPQKGDSADH